MLAQARQSEFAAALFDPAAPLPLGLTTARGAPDPARFAVYRNNVVASLIRALEQRFPVCRKLVGDDFFRLMARDFLAVSPPTSPLILAYGDDFPAFIADFEPARPVPYLSDVARLERTWTQAYHAADEAPLAIDMLAALEPAVLPEARLVPHPSAALIASPWPVGSIWQAHQDAAEPRPLVWEAETVLIVRPEAEVQVHRLPPQDREFAMALFGGACLGKAVAASGRADFDFGGALVGLVSLGAFSALDHSPQGSRP